MKLYRIVGYFLIGTTVVYILIETFVGVEPKLFHTESSQYPQVPLAGINITASGTIGTATVYRGSANYS